MTAKFIQTVGLAAAIMAGVVPVTPSANAATLTEDFSGSFGVNNFFGNITLDVVGGQAISGTGTISILGLSGVPMVLITPSTPGNESSPGPVGYRANDGTDFGGLNTIIPIDSIGLLFDVNTTVASFGAFPLFNLADGNNASAFTGNVGGTEYYVLLGTATITETPLPAALPLFAGGLGVVGLLLRGKKRKNANILAS